MIYLQVRIIWKCPGSRGSNLRAEQGSAGSEVASQEAANSASALGGQPRLVCREAE